MKLIRTDYRKDIFWQEEAFELNKKNEAMNLVMVYPEIELQEVRGFGGAFTEASAYNYSLMSETDKKSFIKDYFSDEGLGYSVGRVHMNSCDFALGNYTYIDKGDLEMKTFSVERDNEHIMPLIKDAYKEKEIPLLVSPWSPPAFVKDSKEMNNGGKLLKEYYEFWADYFIRFIDEYEKLGLKIDSLTIQNEPAAVQTWDSCIYTPEEELEFARILRNKIDDSKYYVKIYGWDHNKESLVRRAKVLLQDNVFDGLALHWYTGDHFENIELCKKLYPETDIIFSEGCVEYSRFAENDEVNHAKMYAHDIIGNFKAGISAFYDWNLLLDQLGGPNHVGNFCEAPIMLDEGNSYIKHLSYYYIGHFSKHLKAGAVVIGSSSFTDTIDSISFKNPDGSIVVVILNKSEETVTVNLDINEEAGEITVEAGSIITVIS